MLVDTLNAVSRATHGRVPQLRGLPPTFLPPSRVGLPFDAGAVGSLVLCLVCSCTLTSLGAAGAVPSLGAAKKGGARGQRSNRFS